MRLLLVLLAVVPLIYSFEGLFDGKRPFPDSWYDGSYVDEELDNTGLDSESRQSKFEKLLFSKKVEHSNVHGKPNDMDVIEWAKTLGATAYVQAAKYSKFENEVRTAQPITAFVPSNKAFAQLPKAYLAYFALHPDRLRKTLQYHTLNEGRNTSTLNDEKVIGTLYGNLTARFNIYPHADRENISTIMGAKLSNAVDVRASNGMVHVLDDFITHFQVVDAYEAVSKCPRFRTLFTAFVVAGLDEELHDEGAGTLFAPTEEAFARLPGGCWEALLKNQTALQNVLKYHVAYLGTYFTRGWVDGESVPSYYEGHNLNITVRGDSTDCIKSACRGRYRVNRADITYANVALTNGIIHVVDRVLFPKEIARDFGVEHLV